MFTKLSNPTNSISPKPSYRVNASVTAIIMGTSTKSKKNRSEGNTNKKPFTSSRDCKVLFFFTVAVISDFSVTSQTRV